MGYKTTLQFAVEEKFEIGNRVMLENSTRDSLETITIKLIFDSC